MKRKSPTQAFKDKGILVLGDVMLDSYLRGKSTRMSPEAPVPVLLEQQTSYKLGGAANVALNLISLGAIPILVSVTGKDLQADMLHALLEQENIRSEFLVASSSRKTTLKTRVMAGDSQMLRIDREDTHDLSPAEFKKVSEKITHILDTWEIAAIIIEDYNKGLLTEKMISFVLDLAKKHRVPVSVDPKEKNFFQYKNVHLFKPNLRELITGMEASISVPPQKKELDALCADFFKKTGVKNIMVTLSEHGVYVNDRKSSHIYPAEAIRIADVSGAGDSVISVVTLAMVSGFTPADWGILANLAGALVCEHPGVVAVNLQKLEKRWTKR